MIKEIIFFTYGDSTDVSTWSNIPFLFSTTLEHKGIKVDRVNLLDNVWHKIFRYYGKIESILLRFFYPDHRYDYIRTRIFACIVNRTIKQSVRKYATADYCFFLNFDFYNKNSKIPTLLFCDWTYDILIIDRMGRNMYPFEKRFKKRQCKAIKSANYVVSLFPACAEKMRQLYAPANICYLGGNVINSLYKDTFDLTTFIARKQAHNDILFVGRKDYIEGASLLIQTFKQLQQYNSAVQLHIIGLCKSNFSHLPANVHCYGFLHKDIEVERHLYYDLIINARVFVNPTPKWAGYSSTIEAMYFGTPVIVSPYEDFVNEFGETLDFGLYNTIFSTDALARNIQDIFQHDNYSQLCIRAHDRVKSYTWDAYVDKVLKLIQVSV